MNIVILGCGKIAHRIALGIKHSKANLYGIASRNKEKAIDFAKQYNIENIFNYEECFNNENVDIIYIATANHTHYDLIKTCLKYKKHVICEKPMLSTCKEINEVFDLAKENNCFLMEAHKTCFTPLQEQILDRIHEIGKIQYIKAWYCDSFDPSNLSEWNTEKNMGGSFYDIGVYPLCFSNLYANSPVKYLNFNVSKYKEYDCDFDCTCEIRYENNIVSYIQSSWTHKKENKGIIIGNKGTIEIINFWKNTEAKIIINNKIETIKVHQDSDFTGEINHAVECIEKGLIESPRMSRNASLQISTVLEEMKKVRG